MGKLIVFEGIDGSGKSTQFALVCAALEEAGVPFRRLNFPRYTEESSALIRLYLSGAFGEKPDDVGAYAASTFFAVDRVASYLQDWRAYYENGGLLLTDRYTTSNAIHQGAKLPGNERRGYFKWLYEFEFHLLALPKPDAVIYFDIPAEKSAERLRQREAAKGTSSDIHERDLSYLAASAACGAQAAEFYGWRKISCFSDGTPRSPEDIQKEIRSILSELGYFK